MKINELKQEQIVVGLRIRSLTKPDHLGSITFIDVNDDNYAWILWDGEEEAYSGFYGTDCRCEVIL